MMNQAEGIINAAKSNKNIERICKSHTILACIKEPKNSFLVVVLVSLLSVRVRGLECKSLQVRV